MENNSNEIWKDIEGFEGIYQISNCSRVKSLDREVKGHKSTWIKKGTIMKTTLNHKGYESISLCKNGTKQTAFTHRLVAIAFISNSENKPQINHKNGIKTDNRIENLEWCTNSENQIHAYENGLNKWTENHSNAMRKRGFTIRKLDNSQVSELKKLRLQGYTYAKLSEHFGISGKMCEQIIKGKKYTNENI